MVILAKTDTLKSRCNWSRDLFFCIVSYIYMKEIIKNGSGSILDVDWMEGYQQQKKEAEFVDKLIAEVWHTTPERNL